MITLDTNDNIAVTLWLFIYLYLATTHILNSEDWSNKCTSNLFISQRISEGAILSMRTYRLLQCLNFEKR